MVNDQSRKVANQWALLLKWSPWRSFTNSRALALCSLQTNRVNLSLGVECRSIQRVRPARQWCVRNHSLDLGGRGEDIGYPQALIECLLRSPSKLEVGTGWSQQNLTAHFALSSIPKLKFDVHHVSVVWPSQLLLASTSSHVQLWRGSEKAFNECLGISTVFPTAA